MPKFKVCLQQYVEKTTAIEIEAKTVHDAICLAVDKAESNEVKWEDGDDSENVSCYCVMDAAGNIVYERKIMWCTIAIIIIAPSLAFVAWGLWRNS